jgi:site-specific recombinase XerD
VEPTAVHTAAERCLEDFGRYLSEERGLTKGTVACDVRITGLFLATRPAEDLALDRLSPADVVAFVAEQSPRRGAANVTAGVRAFLRYCHLAGLTPRPLVDAVPTVACWRLAGLPKAVDGATVEALLAGCDRGSPVGSRAYAVLVLLGRLGLRSAEVAALRLEDIDWRAGEVLVRGKGPRLERLPLPADVGEAVAAWLEGGRPRCAAREVITRLRAPLGPLTSGGVGNIVHGACDRAGVDHLHPHQLRHSAATEMLAAGAGLAEIGQVLRHRSPLTTAIYAKVDRIALAALASPWPGATGAEVAR